MSSRRNKATLRAARSRKSFVYRLTCDETENIVFEVGKPATQAAGGLDALILQISMEQLALQHLQAILAKHIAQVQQDHPEAIPFQDGAFGMPDARTEPSQEA